VNFRINILFIALFSFVIINNTVTMDKPKSMKKPIAILLYAINTNNVQDVEIFLENYELENKKTFNLNTYFSDGDTPLMKAIRKNNPELVELFLDKGANPTLRNSITTMTPEEISFGRNPEIIRLINNAIDQKNKSRLNTRFW
jgi:ankyrin repeat protein